MAKLYLKDYFICIVRFEALFQILLVGKLALGYVCKDVWDLKNFVEIRFADYVRYFLKNDPTFGFAIPALCFCSKRSQSASLLS